MRSSKSQYSACLPVAIALAMVPLTLSIGTFDSPAVARTVAVVPPNGVLTGAARIIDGDTIDIAGTRIRLEGIDAPEAGQTCHTAFGQPWSCGTEATRLMVGMTQGKSVECHGQGVDIYGRLLATCFVAGVDINAEMVRQGYAWAFVRYSKAYVAQEADARAQRVGVWQGEAQPAWEYRANRWAAATATAPRMGLGVPMGGQPGPANGQAATNPGGGHSGVGQPCAIKGNVSSAGLVYHMPWSPWYDKVSMIEGKGKRWFCSEAEAQAAGWRPALMRRGN